MIAIVDYGLGNVRAFAHIYKNLNVPHTMEMLDVHFPTTDGRELIFARYTQPEKEQQLLLSQLGWRLPKQPPPRITAKRTVEM